jgi:hypothetical protein
VRDGVDLDSHFSNLTLPEKASILNQIAAVLSAIQAARLPERFTKFGGLTFDRDRRIMSGEAPVAKGSPRIEYGEGRPPKLRELFQRR